LFYFPPHLKHVTTLPRKTVTAVTFDFQQVTNGVCGRVQVRENEHFIDPEVKINGTYYRDMLLTEQLLPVMCEISAEFFMVMKTDVCVPHLPVTLLTK